MKLWGGRFTGEMDSAAWELNASLKIDRRLAPQDVRGSLAWSEALLKTGVLSQAEFERLQAGLQAIALEFAEKTFSFKESDEDIHTAVERRLNELEGPVAGKLHTGRSRNDQVATDLRLWLMDELPALHRSITQLQEVLVKRAEDERGIALPGYTHLQRAQPVLLSHWWLSHFWPLQRDRQRLVDLKTRLAVLPLGSGALAGTAYPVDRTALALALGFSLPSQNSLDAVSDRDFVVEFLFCASQIGVHLSRLAHAVVLFSSSEFGYFELSDAYSTGSSLMPQKKNPDVFELARGKSGVLTGLLAGFLATLKGLPSAYDKDLQEDKAPLFQAYDTLQGVLPVMAGALDTLAINAARMRQAITPSLMATDLADYFVALGLPFRQAHALAGAAVQLARKRAVELDQLSLVNYQQLSEAYQPVSIDERIYEVFDLQTSLSRRNASGGTSPASVEDQIIQARQALSLI